MKLFTTMFIFFLFGTFSLFGQCTDILIDDFSGSCGVSMDFAAAVGTIAETECEYPSVSKFIDIWTQKTAGLSDYTIKTTGSGFLSIGTGADVLMNLSLTYDWMDEKPDPKSVNFANDVIGDFNEKEIYITIYHDRIDVGNSSTFEFVVWDKNGKTSVVNYTIDGPHDRTGSLQKISLGALKGDADLASITAVQFNMTSTQSGFDVILDDITAVCVVAGTVPLNLVSFDGSQNANSHIFSWTTEQEVNVSHFDIEYSTDGKHFEKIGSQRANNTSNINHYNYTNEAYADGENIYRLKMVDFDGTYTYSPMISISSSVEVAKASVYPTLFDDVISIDMTDLRSKSTYTASIIDAKGSVVNVTNFDVDASTRSSKITISDLGHLYSGLYFLRLKNQDTSQTFKIVKK